MRIQEGMVVRTSYGTGPYRILDVVQHCTCPSFMDAVTLLDKAPASRPHTHIVLVEKWEKLLVFTI